MESSNQLNGRVATLQTTTLDNTKTQGKTLCLSFFYHMYGQTMGELSVDVAVPSDGISKKYFVLKGNQKVDDWQQGMFAFDTPNKPFKVCSTNLFFFFNFYIENKMTRSFILLIYY